MTNDPFYVYLLLKQPTDQIAPSRRFDPENVLYVGKGKGYRWRSHFTAALKAGATEATKRLGEKPAAIKDALGDDPSDERIERHALIVAGGLTEAEAFRLEAIILGLVGGPAATANLVGGHRADELLVPARDARVFFGAEDLAVDPWLVNGTGLLQRDLLTSRKEGSVMFFVKGTGRELPEILWKRTKRTGRFPNSVVMVRTRDAKAVRRGWNPQDPWIDDEAWTRARRYWSGAPASVELWQQLIDRRGGYLALLVPDPRDRRSVIRYVWKLDPHAPWEDYDDMKKFGFPSGELVPDHPWLGKRPIDRATKRGILRSPNAPAVTLWKDESA